MADLLGVSYRTYQQIESTGIVKKTIYADKITLIYDEDAQKNTLSEPEGPYHKVRNGQKLQRERKAVVPLFDAHTAAGTSYDIEVAAITSPSGSIDVGDLLSDSDSAMVVYGNSMLTGYPSGCVIALKSHTEKFIQPGETYVIETDSARIFKRLYYKDDDPDSEYITCYSDNSMVFESGARQGKLAYPPFNIHRSEIKRIFCVTGMAKRNANSKILTR